MRTSESIKDLVSALSKAQGKIKGAIKDSANPFFKSHYADLDSNIEAIRDQFCENGLSIIQGDQFKDGAWVLETRLSHLSGQWVETDYPIICVKQDPQSFLAANTYARRGALTAIAGLSARDDDGNKASGHDGVNHAPPPMSESILKAQQYNDSFNPEEGFPFEVLSTDPPKSSSGQVSEKQIKRLYAISKQYGWTESQIKDYMVKMFGFDSKNKLTKTSYDVLCSAMERGPYQQQMSSQDQVEEFR